MPRLSSTRALLGEETFQKVRETKLLVVGAGGIGCELLKNLVLVGFANIEIIDLDTIDLSNLNRQFLFRKPDISKPKALVAAATARHFNPSSGINIHARHGNVKDSANDVEWIKGFGLVLNALDNMDARRHVNRLCQAANVPLIESGTAGYLGQVTPLIRDETECFDCVHKPAPKSFPVCTIRATPSEPIHCIVWGKSYLFGKVFGEDDEAGDSDELDQAKADGENADEIDNLKKEAAAFREVREKLGEEDGPRRVFEKVFSEDINRLLSMEDMWKVAGRVKPVPLDYEAIMDGSFQVPPVRNVPAPAPATNGVKKESPNESANGNGIARVLKDQRELSLRENLELFIDSCKRLSARSIGHPDIVLSFDKDDDDTLDFVLATANLRATAYGIANKTRFQVKEMAGNIIPAIATTNAIVAGLIVMQSLALLSKQYKSSRNVFLTADPKKPLAPYVPAKPDPNCAVCRDVYIPIKVDVERCTLGEFYFGVVGEWLGMHLRDPRYEDDFQCAIYEGARVLHDPDFEDNHGKKLAELGVERGKMLTIVDEDEVYRTIHFCICELDPEEEEEDEPFVVPDKYPEFPRRPTPAKRKSPSPSPGIEMLDTAPPAIDTKSKKRAASEEEEADQTKKRKVDVKEEGAGEIIDIE
ncbi:ubiquitin-like 1-activating enzyme E1 B, partial [Tremellales sp. Uapishka_1]